MHCARLSVFFLLLLSLSCFSQSRHAVNLTTNDGLPITSVRVFHKDSRGYLWIGTDAGVVKFDGLEMSVFNSYNGLPGEKVWDIDEDWNGDMWFACFGEGIAKYDGTNFTSYTIEDGLP
ncbi:MAG: histidine kinase, partial [Marinilabiliales bacterium]